MLHKLSTTERVPWPRIAGGYGDLLTVVVSQVHEDITRVDVRGEVDLGTVEHLEEGLDEACTLGKAILLSLEHTTYLDGRGIRVIDRAAGGLKSSGQRFVLVGCLPTITDSQLASKQD